jgi:N-acetylneuraminic acid mutarotase
VHTSIHRFIAIFLLICLASLSHAQTITTGTVSTSLCTGTTVNIPFSITGTFNAGNVFTAQLSDANGDFTSASDIGTLTSISAGSINGLIPVGFAQGSGYRIRVVSSNPAIIGSTNSSDISINAASFPSITITGGTTANVCSVSPITFTATAANAGSTPTYQWKKNSVTIGTNSATYTNSTWAEGDTIRCVVTSNGTCPLPASSYSNNVIVTLENAYSNSWKQKADIGFTQMNTSLARKGAVSFTIGAKAYVGTGNTGKDFWEYDPLTNTWSQRANFGGIARKRACGFSIANKGYIGIGYDGALTAYSDFWEYDPAANTWTQKGFFPGGSRYDAVGFSIGSKGYVGTGYASGFKSDFWEYDPILNSWTQKANFAGVPRSSARGFAIDNKGYVACGVSSTLLNDFWEYDPSTNAWSARASLPAAQREYVSVFSMSGMGYLGLGYNGTIYFQDWWQYNPATDTWISKAAFPGGVRAETVSFTIGDKCYVGTGGNTNARNDLWQYDPSSDQWNQKARFGSTGVSFPASFMINNRGYLATGQDNTSTPKKDLWEYDPTSDTWSQKADFAGVARYAATGFSIGSKGYVGTGYTGSAYLTDFWEYNSALNTWIQKTSFAGTARAYAVGFGITGKGYIGTGYSTTSGMQNDLWEYDPASDTWTKKANFAGGNRQAAAAFSIGGKAYVGTGTSSTATYNNDFYEYDPSTDVWTLKAVFAGTARKFSSGFTIGKKGYFAAGVDASSSNNELWEYDPAGNTWTQRAYYGGTARYGAGAFGIGSKGYAGGGTNGATTYSDFWEFSPTTTSIKTGTVSSICGSSSFNVPYTTGCTNFISNNVFTAQLSDSTGGFANPVTIGTLAGTTSGSITCSLPAGTSTGIKYRIRVVGSNPVTYGSDNGSDVIISSANTWKGGGTSDWNTPANWSCGYVPNSATDDASIDADATPLPILSANSIVRNLTLNGSATLTLNGKILTIGGAVIGTGTLTGSNTSRLLITGAAGTLNFTAGGNTLQSLTLSNGGSATVSGMLNIVK